MANTKTRGVGSKAIRDYLSKNHDATAQQVVDALMAEGIAVNRTQVSQVLTKMGMKRKRRRRKMASGTAAVAGNSALNIDDLIAAKKLVAQVGSIEKVKEALSALARLS